MRTSLEERLEKLAEKQEALDSKMKKLKAEKARKLRKVEDNRKRLIGSVILQCFERNLPVHLDSESDMMLLLDTFLKRKVDREVFGLKPLANNDKKTSQKTGPKKDSGTSGNATHAVPVVPVSEQAKTTNESKKSVRKLPVPNAQDDMASQFNL